MSTTVVALRINRQTIPTKVIELDKKLDAFRASEAYQLAHPGDRLRAEAPMIAERRALAEAFVRTQAGLVEMARKEWIGLTPASVQRKAALGNPARAAAVAQLAALAGPGEAAKLAALLVAEADAAGGYGLKLALSGFAPGTCDDSVGALAAKAGTAESDDALKALLLAKREFARSVGAVATDPARVLEAANEAMTVDGEDGAQMHYAERDIVALIGPPGE